MAIIKLLHILSTIWSYLQTNPKTEKKKKNNKQTTQTTQTQTPLDLVPTHLLCGLTLEINFKNDEELMTAFSADVSKIPYPIFIIDSGCSRPMCNDRRFFSQLCDDYTPVKLADNNIIYTKGIGTIGNFPNIYFVPDLKYNLMSVSYLVELGFTVSFQKGCATLDDGCGKSEIFANQHGHLYYSCLNLTTFRSPGIFSVVPFHANVAHATTGTYLNELIHNRLCHVNDKYIRIAIHQKLVLGIQLPNIEKRNFCESCAFSKAHRTNSSKTPGSDHKKSRSESSSTSGSAEKPKLALGSSIPNRVFQKFVVDVKGPLPPDFKGHKYALIFTCYVSRYRFVYFLKTKDEAILAMRQFIMEVRKHQHNISALFFEEGTMASDWFEEEATKSVCKESSIETICTKVKSDNGGEFVNEEVTRTFDEHGVRQELTSPYTPHQNGIAERSNRTLFELVHAILVHSQCPMTLWSCALRYVVYVINFLPNAALSLKSTPFIEVHKRIPDISHLRVFGCDMYVTIPDHAQQSFGPKSIKVRFLGFDFPNSLSYLYYHNGRLQKTGHCTFNENMHKNQPIVTQQLTDLNYLMNPLNFSRNSEENRNEMPPNQSNINQNNKRILNHSDDFENSDHLASNQQNDDQTHESDDGDLEKVAEGFENEKEEMKVSSNLPPSSRLRTIVNNKSRSAFAKDAHKEKHTLYAGFSKVIMEDARNAIVSGKHFDFQFHNFQFFPQILESLIGEVLTDRDAQNSPNSAKWAAARMEEVEKLLKLGTFVLIHGDLAEGKRALPHKWVYKEKQNILGERIFKARMVIKGFFQREFLDFDETFSPVSKITSVRLLLSFGASNGWFMEQFDVENAFPNAELDDIDDIYMVAPSEIIQKYGCKVVKLKKALYGLKQASRQWYLMLLKILIGLDFKQLVADNCLFCLARDGFIIVIAIYVDDMVVASTLQRAIDWAYSELSKHVKLKRSLLRKLLGYRVHYDQQNRRISIDMNEYTAKFIEETHHLVTKITPFSVKSPIEPNTKLSREDCPQTAEQKADMATFPYRQTIGCLNYLSCHARPDISFATNFLARFMDNPGKKHWYHLLRVVAYLRDNPIASITYNTGNTKTFSIDGRPYVMSNNQVYCYCDSDLASTDLDNRKSTTGYVIYYNNGLVSWKSGLQSTVSTSSAEAEYKALNDAAKESIWISNLLAELGFVQNNAPIIFEDNTSAIAASENPVQHSQLKHLDMKVHQNREFVTEKKMVLFSIRTTEQFADQLTKGQPPLQHQYFLKHLINTPPHI
jgi:hypothetical protein